MRSWQVLGLGRARGRYPLLVATQPPQVRWLPDERRAAVLAELAEPRLSDHRDPPVVRAGGERAAAAPGAALVDAAPGDALNGAMPRLLLGDLNLPGGLPARITGWTPLVEAATFPAPAPRLQLDHVLAHGLPPSTRASARVVELEVSDHRAVLVDLELPG